MDPVIPTAPDLRVDLGPLSLANPVMTASGPSATAPNSPPWSICADSAPLSSRASPSRPGPGTRRRALLKPPAACSTPSAWKMSA